MVEATAESTPEFQEEKQWEQPLITADNADLD